KYKNNSPSEFIQLAESNNMIIDIGRIVIDKTLKIAKQLEKYNVKLSLNVSPAQMLQAGFISEFMDKLQTYDVEPNGIAIEITETFLMSSFDVIVEKIKILKNAGIDIHLDDFGTGYSSLQYLQELPFDAIKIDRAFVMHLPNDKYSKAIIGMITTLAKNLNVEVIAEGVETKEQYQFLYKANCSIIQGYLLSKAVNMDDAIQLLKKYNENKEPLYTDEIKKKRGGR
ncbi:MAG: EAL domain-containing protein, partial [Acholeplasmataceae bacterium]|nr:EAL domain-containing protein [Acholeplasmataceae bacterium]